MNTAQILDRYFAGIAAQDIDSLMSLYADNATFVLPSGRTVVGAAAIRELHLSVFAASAPIPSPVATVIGDSAAAVEIQARLPDGSVRRTANFYHLDDTGAILRLSVYMQGG